jgi:hypothetical protein
MSYCGAAEDGYGFFTIQTARYEHIIYTAQTPVSALAKVQEGSVSADLLKSELARVLPLKWD